MKVRKLLEIQSKFEEAVIPSDMNNDELEKHYSESKDKEINILDMDLIHLVRSYSKCLGKNFDSKFHVHDKIKLIKKEIREIENIIEDD